MLLKKNQYFEMGRMQNEVSICKRTPGTRLGGMGGGEEVGVERWVERVFAVSLFEIGRPR